MLVEIKENTREKAMKMFLERLSLKRKKKGNLSFNSPLEGFGKIQEENFELLCELHNKDWDKFSTELLDVMISCFWTLCSIEENKNNS